MKRRTRPAVGKQNRLHWPDAGQHARRVAPLKHACEPIFRFLSPRVANPDPVSSPMPSFRLPRTLLLLTGLLTVASRLIASPLYAQTGSLEGRVTNGETGAPCRA